MRAHLQTRGGSHLGTPTIQLHCAGRLCGSRVLFRAGAARGRGASARIRRYYLCMHALPYALGGVSLASLKTAASWRAVGAASRNHEVPCVDTGAAAA